LSTQGISNVIKAGARDVTGERSCYWFLEIKRVQVKPDEEDSAVIWKVQYDTLQVQIGHLRKYIQELNPTPWNLLHSLNH